mmetsp:Transcript_42808/g.115029  ORF Transcript_42808/g.115029 Transcript_42808/m.115029 type:complete len:324 (-) Transcript_42808:487-1458(-)
MHQQQGPAFQRPDLPGEQGADRKGRRNFRTHQPLLLLRQDGGGDEGRVVQGGEEVLHRQPEASPDGPLPAAAHHLEEGQGRRQGQEGQRQGQRQGGRGRGRRRRGREHGAGWPGRARGGGLPGDRRERAAVRQEESARQGEAPDLPVHAGSNHAQRRHIAQVGRPQPLQVHDHLQKVLRGQLEVALFHPLPKRQEHQRAGRRGRRGGRVRRRFCASRGHDLASVSARRRRGPPVPPPEHGGALVDQALRHAGRRHRGRARAGGADAPHGSVGADAPRAQRHDEATLRPARPCAVADGVPPRAHGAGGAHPLFGARQKDHQCDL